MAEVVIAKINTVLIDGKVKRAWYLLVIFDFESFCRNFPPYIILVKRCLRGWR